MKRIVTERALAAARVFIRTPLPYQFTELEGKLIDCFFTNRNLRVAFLKNLPESVVTALVSMYSRMTNARGARGIFVDSWVPSMLAAGLTEVTENEAWRNNPQAFLSHHNITNLQDFWDFSTEAAELVSVLIEAFSVPPAIWESIASSSRARRFISVWLDKYGHNSIARMGVVHFLVEGVSILTAKSLEWARPGSGYVELSSRYVNLANALLYPIWEEWDITSDDVTSIREMLELCFQLYREMQGSAEQHYMDGYLKPFLQNEYAAQFMQSGQFDLAAFGELCDVGGNFLPNCTLTSLGVTCSGESFPSILRHLILDGTAENLALVELILEEAVFVGADQFARHYEPTLAEVINWTYPAVSNFVGKPAVWALSEYPVGSIASTLLKGFNLWDQQFATMGNVRDHLFGAGRGEYDKLPREFEAVSLSFAGTMSFRGWRDLHRMGMSGHKRTLVTPNIDFYRYDKPAPKELHHAFKDVAHASGALYSALRRQGIDEVALQYILPMGWLVGFSYTTNLRQQEFVEFQRLKPDVNHEVRQVVLSLHAETTAAFPQWASFSTRGNTVKAFAFARGEPKIPLLVKS